MATPLGNVEDLSLRAVRTLKEADRVLAEDTRRTGALLAHLGLHKPMLSLHEHNERDRIEAVLQWLAQGEQLALVSDAGTPTFSDPGFPLVRAVSDAGFRVTPVPGPSALTAAVSVAGLPTDRVLFLGFLPGRPGRRRRALQEALDGRATVVLFLSPHRLLKELDLLVSVAGGERPACLCRELTKVHEEVRRSTLFELRQHWAARRALGEFVLVIGGAEERPEAEEDELGHAPDAPTDDDVDDGSDEPSDEGRGPDDGDGGPDDGEPPFRRRPDPA